MPASLYSKRNAPFQLSRPVGRRDLTLNGFTLTWMQLFLMTYSMGIGCVLHNSSGLFLATKAIPIQLNFGPKEAEAVGVREAVSRVK